MLAEGQLISRLSGSSLVFLSNNSVAVIKEVSSNTSSDTTTGTESGEEVSSKTSSDTSTETESGEEVSTTPAADTENTETEGAAASDTASMEGDTGMVQSSGEVAVDPAMTEGTQVDPTMQAGMAGGKGTLLSSWPFVGGISITVILVSIAIGAFLARRKIKKGIEIYED